MTITSSDLMLNINACVDGVWISQSGACMSSCDITQKRPMCTFKENFKSINPPSGNPIAEYGEGECPPEIAPFSEGYDVSIDMGKKRGVQICLTEEAMDRAKDCKLKEELGKVMSQYLEMPMAYAKEDMELREIAILNNAFTTNMYKSSATPQALLTPQQAGQNDSDIYYAPDGLPLIGYHYWGGASNNSFNNQAVNNPQLSASSLMQAIQHGKHNIYGPDGRQICVNYDTLYVVDCSPAHIEFMRLTEQFQRISPNTVDQQNIFRNNPCFNLKICLISSQFAENTNAWFLHDSKIISRMTGGKFDNSVTYNYMDKLQGEAPFKKECGNVCITYAYRAVNKIVHVPIDWYGSNGSGQF